MFAVCRVAGKGLPAVGHNTGGSLTNSVGGWRGEGSTYLWFCSILIPQETMGFL